MAGLYTPVTPKSILKPTLPPYNYAPFGVSGLVALSNCDWLKVEQMMMRQAIREICVWRISVVDKSCYYQIHQRYHRPVAALRKCAPPHAMEHAGWATRP
ncbi:hypothetical protein EVAR_46198_1 [Eumeta japonica]|uniref:Uncharacterized protein n=1 Tax=Eumeta variegata TaxID=151549 RepID=A0A4C1WE73_EUMVA|nr:hypothetical protein EVAR_46198_1 [Eumeta japonica]